MPASPDKIIERLGRRQRKVASAMITPVPISNAVVGENITGDILYYMFPSDGKITKGIVFFGSFLPCITLA